MSYFEALLYIVNYLSSNTHTSVQVTKNAKDANQYAISFSDCIFRDQKTNESLDIESTLGNTLEDAAKAYYHYLKNKIVIFHPYSTFDRYDIYGNMLIAEWEKHIKS